MSGADDKSERHNFSRFHCHEQAVLNDTYIKYYFMTKKQSKLIVLSGCSFLSLTNFFQPRKKVKKIV